MNDSTFAGNHLSQPQLGQTRCEQLYSTKHSAAEDTVIAPYIGEQRWPKIRVGEWLHAAVSKVQLPQRTIRCIALCWWKDEVFTGHYGLISYYSVSTALPEIRALRYRVAYHSAGCEAPWRPPWRQCVHIFHAYTFPSVLCASYSRVAFVRVLHQARSHGLGRQASSVCSLWSMT